MKSQIQTTKNYNQFASITGNRNLNSGKIDKIVTDVNAGFNMLPYYPIIVFKDGDLYRIIDGQHRFEVSKKTDNDVHFVVCENITLKQIATLNSRGEKWKPTDFMNCYIKLGLSDYEEVLYIMQQYKINIKLAVDLLMYYKHHGGQNSSETFQDGNFKCNFKKETIELLDLVQSIFGRYRFCFDRYLVGAVLKLQEVGKCDFVELQAKVSMAPMSMDKQADLKSYLNNIEQVYNFKNSIRRTIF
jgi:hypothetical protein